MLGHSSLIAETDEDMDALVSRLQQEVNDLKHDLRMVLTQPVFRTDPPPRGQKVVCYTSGHICTVGCVTLPTDAEQWCELPMRRENFERRRKYRGTL